MSSTGTPKHSPSNTQSLKDQVISSMREAVYIAELGMSAADEMRSLFRAIHKLSQNEETILGLSRIGLSLADDRLNDFDLTAERMKEKLAALKGASHA